MISVFIDFGGFELSSLTPETQKRASVELGELFFSTMHFFSKITQAMEQILRKETLSLLEPACIDCSIKVLIRTRII